MSDRPYIFDLSPQDLSQLLAGWDMAPYRAKQVLEWVYRRRVNDPQLMSNLSKLDRDKLAAGLRFTAGRVVRHQTASDGVQKLLMQWDAPTIRPARSQRTDTALSLLDDASLQTECVMIPAYEEESDRDVDAPLHATEPRRAVRRTACVSSQVGCPVGCRFCASGLGGLDGNLSSGQIVEQVWRLNTLLSSPGEIEKDRITNVVFMGMGEPLSNFEQVIAAVRTLMADWGMGISGRRITISTVGLPAQIRRLAQVGLPVTLAISLHAPNDEIRRKLIPWAEYVTIEQLMDAGQEYFDQTGREITLEYILLGGVNDQAEHARELAQVARGLRSNVNLIRYNEVRGMPFDRPGDDDVHRFQAILRKAGVNTHIRASRGRDIAAACGQLRHEHVAVR